MKIRTMLLAATLLTMPYAASAAIPGTIHYQGRLNTTAGTPVNGAVSITFSIYNAVGAAGAIWTSGPCTVTVSNGLFSVELGSVTPFGALAFDVPYWLGVKVGTDAEMTPRKPLTSVPYAMRAGDADHVGGLTAAQLQGATGPAGPTGATGSAGPQGNRGLTGPAGPAGPQGSTGIQGPVGLQGIQGPAGPTGAKGINWRGPWSAATNYQKDDTVSYSGSLYISILAGTGKQPDLNPLYWQTLLSTAAPGCNKTTWYSAYAMDMVSNGRFTFISIVNVGLTANTVTVTFYDTTGSPVGSPVGPRGITVPAGGVYIVGTHTSLAVNKVSSAADFEGYVQIEATAGLSNIIVQGMLGTQSVSTGIITVGPTLSFYCK